MANPFPSTNRLLGALQQDDAGRLHDQMEPIVWPLGTRLNESGRPIEYAYFPTSGLASIVAHMSDGRSAEVGLVGCEGLVGLSVLLGSGVAAHSSVVQVEGAALRIRAIDLSDAFNRGGELHAVLSRYAEFRHVDAAQLAACNALHALGPRCARWILRARDSLGSDQFRLTHELMAVMLGVRRAGVSVAAKALQQDQLIRYANGLITILDGPGLEAAACECYPFMRSEATRLLRHHAQR